MSRHRFHGDPARLRAVADYIATRSSPRVRYLAGRHGMLARLRRKQYNYAAEVVDQRGRTLVGLVTEPAESVVGRQRPAR